VVVNFRERFELVKHLGFVDASQQSIALLALGKGDDEPGQVEPAIHSEELLEFGRAP
jgi:hypothetical protein